MLYLYNKLVYDYINGEDIDNIDELENDYKFMMEVIRVSKDKNIYNLCSPDVKKNYEFVRYIIDTFKYDKDFVDKVANNYFNCVGSSDITCMELYFVMREIFTDYDDDRSLFYNVSCFGIYEADRAMIYRLVSCENESFGTNNIGLGFSYVIGFYANKSDIITKYYAKRFLNEIFYNDEKITLEELIHSNYKNVNLITSVGVKKFILDFVKRYDSMLSDYLFAHIDLIKNIEKDINKIINNWDRFNDDTLDRKNFIFEQEVNNLISKYDVSFDYLDVCTYIDSNLNLPIKLGMIGFEELYSIDVNRISLLEYECLRKIIKLAKDLFGSSVIDTEYEYNLLDDTSNKFKGRILEFKTNTK